jgi:nicotianamine synthase
MEDLKIFNRILKLDSLKPSKKTNDAFSDLVKFCEENNDVSLKKDQIKKLRDLSSVAEYEMELYWAKKILDSKNGNKELEKFWYYRNYEQLVDLEHSNIICLYKKIRNVLFIGGGPLPLTAIVLCRKYNLRCTILEKDPSSYSVSVNLIEKIGLSNMIKVVNMDAENYSGYGKFDIIYLAAMVGHDEKAKSTVISLIHDKLQKGKVLLCRSSHGTRKLLYTPVAKKLLKEVNPVLEVRPYNSIINSFFILQKT